MTNKEAIHILTSIKNTPTITWENGADIALDLAIKALEERPTGEWISKREAEKLGATCLARRNENGELEAIINLDNAPTVDITRKIQSELISEVSHSIARQFLEHNEVVPFWLSIGDIRIKEAEND